MVIGGRLRAMRNLLIALALLSTSALAEDKPAATSPNEIVAAAPKADWTAIAASDLLVMDLAPPARGPGQASAQDKPRRVVIQLMPQPFSQGWIGNVRKLAAARWWDGLSVNRVQDNYVVQWGDGEAEDKAKAKKLPAGLAVVPEREYGDSQLDGELAMAFAVGAANAAAASIEADAPSTAILADDPYEGESYQVAGWPLSYVREEGLAPVHCYGMVGVGRDMPPDTGSGAELYTVIGHAPRHLDRNIALVGRVIEGIEHMSSLPRGTAPLGFYATAEERTKIVSIRLASDLPSDKPFPAYEYLSTESTSFAAYAEARANRRDPFFIRPAGGADICNIPVPVRRVK